MTKGYTEFVVEFKYNGKWNRGSGKYTTEGEARECAKESARSYGTARVVRRVVQVSEKAVEIVSDDGKRTVHNVQGFEI